MHISDIIGTIAAIAMVFGYLPQTVRTIRTRSTDDIAMGTFLMMGLSKFELAVLLVAVVLLLIADILHEKQKSITTWLNGRSRIFRWFFYLGMVFILFIAAVRQFGGEASGFIYAQFYHFTIFYLPAKQLFL